MRTSTTRNNIMFCLDRIYPKGMQVLDIAKTVGKLNSNIQVHLLRMLKENIVQKTGYGQYALTVEGHELARRLNDDSLSEVVSVTVKRKNSFELEDIQTVTRLMKKYGDEFQALIDTLKK